MVAVLYIALSAGSLPSLIPGHETGSTHHHIKHGIAALALAAGAFVLAWFQTEAKPRGTRRRCVDRPTPARRGAPPCHAQRVQPRVRFHLADGRTLLIGFRELQLRDQHNRGAVGMTYEQARELLSAQPEPQRTSGLDLLDRQHLASGPA